MTCTEKHCRGTVIDGYCDVCGTAPAVDAPSVHTQAGTKTIGGTTRNSSSNC